VKFLSITVSLILAALAAFALLNWGHIAAPTALSVGVTTVNAPLGLVLLVFCAALTAACLAFAAYEQARSLAAARRWARDLHAQRELADRAEQSRFQELRAWLETELRELRRSGSGGAAPRGEELESALVTRVTEATNGLAAHLSEIEDKLDRVLRERQVATRS
jgi:hypothetical protein